MSGIGTTVLIIGAILLGGALFVFIIARVFRSLLLHLQNSLPMTLLSHLKQDMASGNYLRRLQQPLSLSGMDAVYGPQIQDDFPELNLDELKRRAERLAFSTLEAIGAEDIAVLSESGNLYSAQVRQYLAGLKAAGQSERFENITIHKTVISFYRKFEGTCRIVFQIALAADYQKTGSAETPVGDQDGITQFKFEIEALYIQNLDFAGSHMQEALAFNCPNCGAPVSSLGDRLCLHCGSAIEPLNIRVWTFSSFRQLLP